MEINVWNSSISRKYKNIPIQYFVNIFVFLCLFIQQEDDRLKYLTSQLELSLSSLGLAGSEVSDVNILVYNITQTQQGVSDSLIGTEQKVNRCFYYLILLMASL